MDLARQRQTIHSLISNLEIAHQKLSQYHCTGEANQINQKWISKNISRNKESPTKEASVADQVEARSEVVNLSSVNTFSDEFNQIYRRVVRLLYREKEDVELMLSQNAGEEQKQSASNPLFLITMQQFFYLFQSAQNEILLERKKLNRNKSSRGLVFTNYCGDCVTCAYRNRDEPFRFQKNPQAQRMKVNNQSLIAAHCNDEEAKEEPEVKDLSGQILPNFDQVGTSFITSTSLRTSVNHLK